MEVAITSSVHIVMLIFVGNVCKFLLSLKNAMTIWYQLIKLFSMIPTSDLRYDWKMQSNFYNYWFWIKIIINIEFSAIKPPSCCYTLPILFYLICDWILIVSSITIQAMSESYSLESYTYILFLILLNSIYWY